MPGIVAGTEWAACYEELATAFGLTIDTVGPHSGTEPLLDVIAASPDVATVAGERTHLLWPAHHDLRRVTLRDPAPVYPRSLIRHDGDTHPALARLRAHLGPARPVRPGTGTWTPSWDRWGPPGRVARGVRERFPKVVPRRCRIGPVVFVEVVRPPPTRAARKRGVAP
jgi:hypothetical protein